MDTTAQMMSMDGQKLTAEDFGKVGGLKRSIDKQAELVFHQFALEHTAIQRLFQRLTERGEGEKPIRKPETFSVLEGITGLSADRLSSVVKAFVENGLLVTRPLENGEIEVDLPHECIAWKWKRLAGWIEEEVAEAKSLLFFSDSAARKLWLGGSVLAEAKSLSAGGRLDGPWARRYLASGDLDSIKDWIGKSDVRERAEFERLQRDQRRARVTAVVSVLFALFVGGLAWWALQQKSAAGFAKRQAEATVARSYVQDGMVRLAPILFT